MIRDTRSPPARISRARYQNRFSSYFVHRRLIDIDQPLESIVERLNAFKPHFLSGNPSTIEILAHQQKAGALKLNLRGVSTYGEFLAPPTRRSVELAFACGVNNAYGAAEQFLIANDYSTGNMRVLSDLVIVEPIDREGNTVPLGVASHKVLLTSLGRFAQPIIRYEIEDSVVLSTTPDNSGASVLTIDIIGRASEVFRVLQNSGELEVILPSTLIMQVADLRGISKFQIRREARDRIKVLFVPRTTDITESLSNTIKQNFKTLFSKLGLHSCVTVETEAVVEIERGPGGKSRRLVNLAEA